MEAVGEIISKGYQIHPDVLTVLDSLPHSINPLDVLLSCISKKESSSNNGDTLLFSPVISLQDLREALPEEFQIQIEKKIQTRKSATTATTVIATTTEVIEEEQKQSRKKNEITEIPKEIEVLIDPTKNSTPSGMEGFQTLFESRLKKTFKIFSERPDSSRLQKIEDIKKSGKDHQQQRNESKIVGLVTEKISRRNQIALTIEDSTDQAQVLVVNDAVKRAASEVLLDQVIALDVYRTNKGQLMAKSIYHPDIPDRTPSFSKKRVYAVLISDLHIGSKMFLSAPFERFIQWLDGNYFREDRDDPEIIKRIGYIIIGGDCVDGVGVYPDQEYQLAESDIYKQYEILTSYLERIPKRISLIIGPGNHDATRQALPQPTVSEKYASGLHKLPNAVMVGDPTLIKLHGVKFLVYHGRSLDDVLAVTPGLSYSRPASAMKVLLRARHLAPTFGSRTPIAPEAEDNLVISEVPDVFHSGHVHTTESQTYKGTVIVNSGTWQAQTSFQQNMGIVPTPAIVPIVDLSTLEVFARNFL